MCCLFRVLLVPSMGWFVQLQHSSPGVNHAGRTRLSLGKGPESGLVPEDI